jgi:IPT/TIG domain
VHRLYKILALLGLSAALASGQVAINLTTMTPSTAVAGQAAVAITITSSDSSIPTTGTAMLCWDGTGCSSPATVLTGAVFTASQITASVPATLLTTPGNHMVYVFDSSSASMSNSLTFSITPAPTLSGISPNTAIATQTAVVTLSLSGRDFPTATTPIVNWSFNGGSATGLNVTASTSTSITATIPASLLTTAGPATVVVVSSGVSSGSKPFTVNPGPALSSISPAVAIAGQTAAVTLVLTGTNFSTTSPVVNWTFGGVTTSLTPTPGSATSLTVTVPANLLTTAGTATVAVSDTVTGASSTTQNFTINPGPALTSISPSSALANSGTFTLILTGTNLPATPQVNWVFASATTHLSILTMSATSISATVPANLLTTGGTATVVVVDTVSGSTSGTQNFIINAPTVSSISPTNTVATNPNTVTLTVNGTNFVSGTAVTWCNFCSGSPISLPTNFVSATQLTAQVAASLLTAQGPVTVGVTSGGFSTQTFTINPKPVLASLSQTSAATGQSAVSLTLTGTNFPTTSTVVNWTFNSVVTPLSTGTNTTTSIAATIPANLLTTAGTSTISVTDSVTLVTSNPLSFTISSAGVGSITPTSTTAGTANQVMLTVNGTNFVNGTSTVTWCNSCGGSPTNLMTTFVSTSQLTAVVPTTLLTAAGTAQVGVNNGSGTGATQPFTINPKPVLSTLSQTAATVGQSTFSLTLTGTNFATTSPVVNWTFSSVTTSLNITANSATSITATVPANLMTAAGTATLTVTDLVSQVSSNGLPLTLSSSGVSSISPSKTPAGTANPITLTVTGSNFVSGSSVVTWCNACGGTPVQLTPTTFISTTQLQAPIPTNLLVTAGSAQVGVVTGSVPAPGTQPFIITSAPVLSTLSQTSAAAGQSAFNIILTGTNFPTTSTIVNWTFNGQTTALSVTANSSTSITAAVSSALLTTAGTATIAVTDSVSLVSSNTLNFTINGPTVTSVSPTGAVAGTSSPVTVTVNGTNFVPTSTVTWCNSCGTSPVSLSTTYVGGSQLTAVIPINLLTASATSQIGVINSAGTQPTSTQTFTVGAGPSLSSLSSTSAIAGQAAFTLTLSGTNFPTPSPVVNWKVGATTTALAVTSSTATSISVTVTAALLSSSGNAAISVTDSASGVTSNSLTFTITGPVVTSISPSVATAGTSSPITITITGSNFVNGSIATWCNSCGSSPVQLTTSYVSGSQIMATIPSSLLTTSGTAQVGVINSSSGSPTSTQNFVINPKPTLTSLSQQFAIVNAANPISLTLTGSNFPIVNTLVNWTFSGQTTSLAITASSASSLTATVPTSLLTTAGTATVSVSDSVSLVSSNTQPFVIASGPQISTNGLNPSSIAVGSPTFSLMITGADFAAGNVLIWTPSGGTPITIPSSSLTVGSGGTSITATITASLVSTVGTVSIAVQDAVDNVTSNLETFTVGGPTLTSISPTGTTIGVTNSTTLTVNGTNFVNGVSTVTWCNSCGSTPTPLTTTFVSSSQLTAVIPASLITAQGAVQIGVQNGNVPSTGTQFFTIGAVGLTMISPATASAGSPGFSITITGSNFTNAASVVFTLGTTVQSLTTTFVSATQLQAFVPTSLITTSGTANVSVQVGTSVSNAATFSIVGPVVSTLTPNQSATGVGSFPITVTGSNFLSGSIVQWTFGGTTTPLSTSFQDASTLVAVVNSAQVTTAGTALVSVMNTGGAVSPSVIFTVGAAPSISTNSSGLSPSTATAGSGTTAITITGTNFQSGSIVTWNNAGTVTSLATGFNSSTQLTATVPASLLATSGSALITVQNPGPVNSNSVTFTIAAGVTPSVTPPLVPSSAAAGGAPFQLTVMGTNFVNGSMIQWNNGTTTTALSTSFSSNQLSALVPASLIATAGTAFVSVLNPGGGTSATVAFTISSNQPTIDSTSGLAPTSAQVGSSSLQLTVTGTGFVSGSVVMWNAGSSAQSVPTVFVSTTSLTAIVPATDLATAGTVQVTVNNPGGAVSNTALFSVTPAAAPVINTTGGLAPSSAVIGSPSFLITVSGSNFFSGSTVQWSAGSTPTTLSTSFISGTQLSAVVPSSLLTGAGSAFVSVLNPGGVASNMVTFTVGTAPGPTITGLTPTTATAGGAAFQLVVAGTNFGSGSVVQWNGGTSVTALATIVLSSTQLSALVPATLIAAPGTAFVDVMNPGGGISNLESYTISSGAAPSINSTAGLAPANATVGSTSIQLSVLGSNFTSTSVVQWSSGSTPTALSTVFVSSTQLSAIIPTSLLSTAGTAFVSVTNGSGNVSNSVPFNVASPSSPTISTANGLVPASAAAGSAAMQLIVVGTNFVQGTIVFWNNGTNQALTTSFVSPTQVTAVLPASLLAASGVAFVSVQNPGPLNSNSVPFTIGASATLPTVNSFMPASAAAGGATFQLTVAGANFQNGAIVLWNSNGTAQNLTTGFSNSGSLSALVPAALIATPGISLISVMNPDKNVSNSSTFNITGSIPILTQLTPPSAAAGTQGLLVSATGSGFASGSTILWGTTPLPTSFTSATQLTATVGTAQLATSGTTSVTVQSPGGVSNAINFVVGGPVISLLSPAGVTAGAPAFTLSVGGDNFVSGAVVNFGGTALTTTFVSTSQLMAAVPATAVAANNSVSVTISNPGGAVSPGFGFAVGAVPAVQTLTPSSAAPGSPAFTLQVAGTDFVIGDTVQWNGVALATTFASATSLSAMVPSNLIVNSGAVNVSVLQGGGVVSNAVVFTINSATLTTLSPATAPAGSPALQLTISGTAFVNGSIVQWNGSPLPTTFVSATQLSATVSASQLAMVGTSFVAVANPGGSLTSGTTFTVAGPTLTTVSPNSATAGAASLALTLTGTNFVTNSVASWNGTMLPTSVASATSATAQVSASLLANAGTFVIVMANPGGSVTASQFFTLNAPSAPTVSGVTPASAVAGGSAFQLTVAGSGFVSGAVVQWNGSALATSYVGPTQLSTLVGANLIATPGTANITIQVPGAPLSATTAFPINPPSITTLAPATVSAGGPAFVVTVTGGNFIPGSTVQWNGTSLPTIYNSATQLTADVAASFITSGGTASVTVQNGGTATSAPSTFTSGPFTLVITSTTLPDAVVGTGYSQILTATGGSPPYTWSVTAGTLPAGITLDPPSGTLSGTATAAVTGTIGFTVTDSVARTVTKSVAFRSVAPLSITTTTPLTSAPAGVSFSQILAATGGTAPYTWSLTGSLPTGLALNTSTGQISGTPTVPGSYNFTINIADTRSQTSSVPFTQTVTAAGITIGGVTTASTSGQQLPVNLTIASPYSVNLTGTLTLVFTSAVGASDPAIQFSSGGLTANFTIPAGTTQAVFGTQQSVLLITGTTAGSIVLTASLQASGATVTPTTAPTITTTIAKAPPVITGVTFTTSGTSLVISVTGYSNTRDMTTGNFQFIAATNSTLTAAPVAVNLASTFSAWYQSSASLNFGTQFTFSVPISFTGSINAIGSVSVTLVNSAGTSAAVTATRQ